MTSLHKHAVYRALSSRTMTNLHKRVVYIALSNRMTSVYKHEDPKLYLKKKKRKEKRKKRMLITDILRNLLCQTQLLPVYTVVWRLSVIIKIYIQVKKGAMDRRQEIVSCSLLTPTAKQERQLTSCSPSNNKSGTWTNTLCNMFSCFVPSRATTRKNSYPWPYIEAAKVVGV